MMDAMSDDTPNGLLCVQCGTPLVGRQTKYCSDACRVKTYRDRKRERERQTGTKSEDETPNDGTFRIDNSRAMIEVTEQRNIALARLEAANEERDRLTSKVDQLQSRNVELERENASLGAKLELTEQGKGETPNDNRLIYAALAIMAIIAAAFIYYIFVVM